MTGTPATPPAGPDGSGGDDRGSRGGRLSRGGGRDRIGGRTGQGRGRDRERPRGRPHTHRPPEPDPARAAALDLLTAVRERGAYANLALPPILAERGLTGRDAALATEIGYGTCRSLGQLDAVITACGDRPLADLDGPVLDALRLGTYQVLHTRIPPHAAVSATVDLVRAGRFPRAGGYVNAVLRRVAERDLPGWIEQLAPAGRTDPLSRLALASAHPRWIVTALADALGVSPSAPAESQPAEVEPAEGGTAGRAIGADRTGTVGAAPGAADQAGLDELASALEADGHPPAVHLVARPGRISRADLVAETGGEPGRFSPYAVYLPGGDPAGFPSVARGAAGVQDEGSQLVAAALAAAPLAGPDRRWLDLAAGPGGKAALLGALAAQCNAAVDAVEVAPHRAELVRSATRGLPVTVHTADGRDPGLDAGVFDRVLLDAPCTGLGALRRRPEARWRRTEADVGPLVRLQRELLASAARLVRPGGVIGYVTCSPHVSETAGVISRRPDGLALLDARDVLPGVPDLGPGPMVQLWPHRHGTDGMFLALLRRR